MFELFFDITLLLLFASSSIECITATFTDSASVSLSISCPCLYSVGYSFSLSFPSLLYVGGTSYFWCFVLHNLALSENKRINYPQILNTNWPESWCLSSGHGRKSCSKDTVMGSEVQLVNQSTTPPQFLFIPWKIYYSKSPDSSLPTYPTNPSPHKPQQYLGKTGSVRNAFYGPGCKTNIFPKKIPMLTSLRQLRSTGRDWNNKMMLKHSSLKSNENVSMRFLFFSAQWSP